MNRSNFYFYELKTQIPHSTSSFNSMASLNTSLSTKSKPNPWLKLSRSENFSDKSYFLYAAATCSIVLDYRRFFALKRLISFTLALKGCFLAIACRRLLSWVLCLSCIMLRYSSVVLCSTSFSFFL